MSTINTSSLSNTIYYFAGYTVPCDRESAVPISYPHNPTAIHFQSCNYHITYP